MDDNLDPLESLWDRLLSGEPELVREAFTGLDEVERRAVIAHLERMASEAGWLPEQRAYAQAALAALDSLSWTSENH
jgi:hypothetical protein